MIISAILPLFLLVGTGWIAAQSGYLSPAHAESIGDLVVRLALPALIFLAIAGAPSGEQLDPGFLVGYAGASLLVFAIVFLAARFGLGRPVPQAAILALGTSSSTSGYLGYPIAYAVIGAPAASLLVQCVIIENVLMLPLGYLLSAPEASSWSLARPVRFLNELVRHLVTNPLILAVIAGFAVASVGIRLPAPLLDAIGLLSKVTGPAALIVVGLSIAALPLDRRAFGGAAVIAVLKLSLHPVTVWAFLSLMPGTTQTAILGGSLFAAVPMLSIYPIFGRRAGLAAFAALAFVIAVVLSLLSVPLVGILGGAYPN